MDTRSPWHIVLMLSIQLAAAGMNILYLLAIADDLPASILVAYRQIFAAAFLIPMALLMERGKIFLMTWPVLFRIFLGALFGVFLSPVCFSEAMALTSPTYVSAISNLVPGVTMVVGILFRLEKVRIYTAAWKAKILGTLIMTGGAMVFTFYQGPQLTPWPSVLIIIKTRKHESQSSTVLQIFGSLLALASCICDALWINIQTLVSKKYQFDYTSTGLTSSMGCLLCLCFALVTKRSDWEQWRLQWNVRLLTVVYSGMMISGLASVAMSWCARVRDPVFVTSFRPLTMLLVAIAGSLILNERLHIGSIIGGIIIVSGLYLTIWGKTQEAADRRAAPAVDPEADGEDGLDRDAGHEPSDSASATVCTTSAVELPPSHQVVDQEQGVEASTAGDAEVPVPSHQVVYQGPDQERGAEASTTGDAEVPAPSHQVTNQGADQERGVEATTAGDAKVPASLDEPANSDGGEREIVVVLD